jgi:hypothetical protein
MKKIVASVIFLSSLICAQSFQIKQITHLPEDCSNYVRSYAQGFGDSYYAFESHMGNASTINLGYYDAANDSFYIIRNVTDDNFMNINPQLINYYDTLFIIYQTNKNGNWDIAYNIYTNNQLSQPYYIANSIGDEINPGVAVHGPNLFTSSRFVSYEFGSSIWLKDMNLPDIYATAIFPGDNLVSYSKASIHPGYLQGSFDYTIAAKKISNQKASIVIKKMNNNIWGQEIIVADSGNVDSPEFQYNALAYTNDLEGEKNIYIVSDLASPRSYEKLILNPQYDYFNYKTDMSDIFTRSVQYFNYFPFSYQVLQNDSLFIRLNLDKYSNYPAYSDTLIYTKTKNSKLCLGLMGYISGNSVFYTFWEDSLNGKTIILGRKTLVSFGDVKDNLTPYSFFLEQNYPNPFNPSTTIAVNIVYRSKVKLAVYDITGREVCILMNEEKMPGRYLANFDTRKYKFSSGVYFYKLTAGLNSSVKKMLLLK